MLCVAAGRLACAGTRPVAPSLLCSLFYIVRCRGRCRDAESLLLRPKCRPNEWPSFLPQWYGMMERRTWVDRCECDHDTELLLLDATLHHHRHLAATTGPSAVSTCVDRSNASRSNCRCFDWRARPLRGFHRLHVLQELAAKPALPVCMQSAGQSAAPRTRHRPRPGFAPFPARRRGSALLASKGMPRRRAQCFAPPFSSLRAAGGVRPTGALVSFASAVRYAGVTGASGRRSMS